MNIDIIKRYLKAQENYKYKDVDSFNEFNAILKDILETYLIMNEFNLEPNLEINSLLNSTHIKAAISHVNHNSNDLFPKNSQGKPNAINCFTSSMTQLKNQLKDPKFLQAKQTSVFFKKINTLEKKYSTLNTAADDIETRKGEFSTLKNDTKDLQEASQKLLDNINDAKLIKGYSLLMKQWRRSESENWKNYRCASIGAALVFIGIFSVVGYFNINLESYIYLGLLVVATYVLSIYSARYKHARYLRAHYDHLIIATNYYRHYINDEKIDKEGKSHELARESAIYLASLIPVDNASKESTLDKFFQDRLSSLSSKKH